MSKELTAEELINSLSPEDLKILQKKLIKKRSPREQKESKYETGWMLITHNYHCEICGGTKSKKYRAKVVASMVGIEIHQKPLELYTICSVCTKRFVLGLALARSMVVESNIERR